jgi:hypothetical protein
LTAFSSVQQTRRLADGCIPRHPFARTAIRLRQIAKQSRRDCRRPSSPTSRSTRWTQPTQNSVEADADGHSDVAGGGHWDTVGETGGGRGIMRGGTQAEPGKTESSMRGPWKLPDGVETPRRYARLPHRRRWWIEGFRTVVDGFSPPNEDDLRRRQGDSAWEAYQLGYAAGQQWKASQEKADENQRSRPRDLNRATGCPRKPPEPRTTGNPPNWRRERLWEPVPTASPAPLSVSPMITLRGTRRWGPSGELTNGVPL